MRFERLRLLVKENLHCCCNCEWKHSSTRLSIIHLPDSALFSIIPTNIHWIWRRNIL